MQKLLRLLIRDKLLLVVSGATFASGLCNTLSLWVRLPEALLSAGEPLHPWGRRPPSRRQVQGSFSSLLGGTMRPEDAFSMIHTMVLMSM